MNAVLQFVRLVTAIALLANVALAASANPPASEQVKAVAYRIMPTDKISVTVIGEAELNVAGKKVDINGNLNLALVQEVHVAGLTISGAQTAIENAYRDGRFLRNPQVSINIEEYAPREVSVQGYVKFPAKVSLPPETIMTLKDVIMKCGGFSDTANGKRVRVSRTLPDGSIKLFENLDIESILLGKSSVKTEASTFIVEPGDIVYVPERII